MNIYLILAILATNIIAILSIYHFIKKMDKGRKILFIAISVATMYILISIIYAISGIGVDKDIHESAKDFVIYLFVPINLILFVPYFAHKYVKVMEKKMKKQKFAEMLFKMIVLLIIVLILEGIYFSQIQKDVATITNKNKKVNKVETNSINNVIKNNIENNQIQNDEITNITNEVIDMNIVNSNNI